MLDIVSSYAIVTLSLRRAVFRIFDFKKCRDREILVRRHLRSLQVAPFDRLCMVSETIHNLSNGASGFLLEFFSNIVPKTHRFLDIRLPKSRDLENRDRSS